MTRDGTLFFRSSREGDHGQGDLYLSRRVVDGYGTPVNLGPTIDSEHGEWNCVVHPDGDFIIFESSGRPSNISVPGDLYIS